MASKSRIVRLSNVISAQTQVIDSYLASENLPSPSLDATAPAHNIPEDAPPEVKNAAQSLIEASSELKALIEGPRELVRFPWTSWVSVKIIIQFELDKSFPVGAETTFDEMSKHSGLSVRNVTRIIRHAIINHRFFEEPRPGIIVHSALTALLARDNLVRTSLQTTLGEFWPAGVRAADAMVRWPNSEEPNETGFSLANNTSKSMYEIFTDDPARGARFGMTMSTVDEKREFLLENYPWESKSSLVDVGGSHGSIPISIVERFSHIKCYVQDLPKVVEEGNARLPEELRDRIEFMAHDFFTEQPISADVYYFRSVMHNWSDKYCIKILRALIPALKPGARVLVHERMLPDLKNLTTADAKRAINMDIGMLQLLNAHQRTEQEWPELFQQADARFRYIGAYQPPGAIRWIIEAEWQG